MRKILAITTLFMSVTGIAFSAPDQHVSEVESAIDSRFMFDTEDFDATTAFISLDGSEGPSIDIDELIGYAKGYLGRPYSSGSKGPKAFDCSGFTSYVFRNFDITLSASSQTQSKQGEAIDRSEIRPGDLLFFKGRNVKGGIGHVALAIDVAEDGEVTFIHAAIRKGISIDKLNSDPYYRSRYVCARRVIE